MLAAPLGPTVGRRSFFDGHALLLLAAPADDDHALPEVSEMRFARHQDWSRDVRALPAGLSYATRGAEILRLIWAIT